MTVSYDSYCEFMRFRDTLPIEAIELECVIAFGVGIEDVNHAILTGVFGFPEHVWDRYKRAVKTDKAVGYVLYDFICEKLRADPELRYKEVEV